ncbi:cell wall-binding repeat-containing protein [Desulfitobacterium metallireducens]|uniref:Cell wall-binding protein n=1 Tax=Desulfitobacterium metallireducens DSM 15288 TaxID=871968 RepID=W0E604_9FIRM|nr:cell wall-binding repeat-containing protein [Desulfitobacterium metallireducens]AHF06290.1 cell wall-binding protein [Desulfitobacterium metallireducens DSM 15288]
MFKIRNRLIATITISTIILVSLSVNIVQASTSAQRIAGVDRYDTSIKISQEGWKNGTSQNVVLATGEDFPDALSAAPLAKKLAAPILLTQKDTISNELMTEFKRLGVQNIYIVGGEGVISKTIEDQLNKANFRIIRLAGTDRYDTSHNVADFIFAQSQSIPEAVVATGENFPDALSIAPIAASNGMPILLSPKDSLPDSILSYFKEHQVTKTYVIGGSGVISETIMKQLPGAQRLSGNDRYETNNAILKNFSNELNFAKVYAATGENYPDALAGSALAALSNSPLILATNNKAGITNEEDNSKIGSILILGGEGVISSEVVDMLVALSNNQVPILGSNEIVYPKNGDTIDSGNLTIKWSSIRGFTNYQVNVTKVGTALGWHFDTRETSLTVGPLEPDSTYQIQITAFPEEGTQIWNLPSVVVNTKSSGNNFLASPINNEIYLKGSPVIVTYSIPSSDKIDWHWYSEIQLSGPSGNWSFSANSGSNIPEYMLTPGKYSLLVILRNSDTGETDYSNKIGFTISN